MASHRRPKQPGRTRVTIFGATAAATVALSSQAAQADPNLSKDEVKEQVDDLYEQVTKINEQYIGAQENEEQLQERADELQESVARGQEELNTLRNSLGSAAAAHYRTGSLDPSVQLFLSSDPDAYLEQASTLNQITGKQAESLRLIEAKQRTLAQQRQEATKKLEELEEVREEIGKKKKKIQGKLNEAQRLLNQLTQEERDAIAAAEADAAARAAAEAQRADRSEGRTELAAGSSRATSALGAAQSKLGSPYVYGSPGPNSFDCSGLTSWAFAQAGISLPRTSQAQANVGTRVSRDQLQPGDLVFFYGDLGHVGIYSGNGQMIHSPRPGTVVRYESINVMPFQFGVRVG
ncbi:C40 family peptidase [Streptomyces sodiiphilus]|uniref:C40 family peptidase n=1 Tax=Streptomyces sodiiphilus TaxID=226217 RepID=A0ABN2PWG4_9ACTN